jgi:Cytochrome c7 and related cytochrome c/Class III cytochrome C family
MISARPPLGPDRKIALSNCKLRRPITLGCQGFLLIWIFTIAGLAEQPIVFPHSTHMKFGLDCLDCHVGANTRAAAGIPSVRKCMLCHAKLAREKPEVKKVIEYAKKNVEIPWERVYGFSRNAHVKFRHAPHYRAGISCSTCHGDLRKATVAERSVTHNMGTCLTCHRQKHASEDCAACHY